MEAMTSSFPSNTRSRSQLDNIIFYSGPASKKRCASPTDAEEWPDIDDTFAKAAQQDFGPTIEDLDFVRSFGVTDGGRMRSPTDASPAGQVATSPVVHSEQADTPPCQPLHQLQDQALYRGVATKPQEESEVSGGQAQTMPTGTSGHLLNGDPEIIALDCHFGDNAQLDLGRESRRDGPILAQTNGDSPSIPKARTTDARGRPVNTPGWLPHGPNSSTDAERSDESPPNGRGLVHRSLSRPPTGGDDRDCARRFKVRRPATEQEDGWWRELDADVNTLSAEAPQTMVSQADPTTGTNAADDENNDSDGPLLPSRRRQARYSVRTSGRAARASSPPTPRSRSHSTEVGSKRFLRRYKQLHRRRKTQHTSSHSDSGTSSATPATPTSSGATSERWPVQCFVQRQMIGSEEMITIELPMFSIRALSEKDALPSPSENVRGMTADEVAARGSKQRTRFSREENDLLVELKERRDPKLSWREIQRDFPNRTIGSLQVHYSTHLKGRHPSRRHAPRGRGAVRLIV